MIWQEEMQRDAVRIALPEWELRDDDIITFSAGWREAGDDGACGYPDCCGGGESWDAAFVVSVSVRTADNQHVQSYEYLNEHAGDFFTKLMRRESIENVSLLDTATRIAKREALRDIEVEYRLKRLSLKSAQDVYESAMRWLSINDFTREEVHKLAQERDGRVMGRPG